MQNQLLGIAELPSMIHLQQQFAESIATNLGPHLEVVTSNRIPEHWGEPETRHVL
jgi:hypothetical protein